MTQLRRPKGCQGSQIIKKINCRTGRLNPAERKISMNYTTFDFEKTPRDERPFYIPFGISDNNYMIEFFTNRDGEGFFTLFKNGTYLQSSGTCDFSMNASLTTQRRRLRNLLDYHRQYLHSRYRIN